MTQYWLDVLGLKMKHAIEKHHYPDLEHGHLTNRDCARIRSIITQAPKDQAALKKTLIKKILNGRIEEIHEQDTKLFFHVKIEFKRDLYIVQLKQDGIHWSFISIEYAGKAQQQPLIWSLSAALTLSVLLLAVLLVQNMSSDTASGEAEELEINEHFNLDDLQTFAEEHHLVLLTQEELDQMINLATEQAIREENAGNGSAEDDESGAEEDGSEAEGEGNDETENEGSEEAVDETFELTIPSGISSAEIGQMLIQYDLLEDEDEFDQILEDMDAENLLRSGTFELSRNDSPREVIETLTGQSS